MKCTDVLFQEHRIMLRALDVLSEMATRVALGERVEPADVEAILNFMQVFGDECHQAKEESALFPVLMRAAAAEKEPLRHMLFEHDQERSLVVGLQDALKTQQGKDFIYYANKLIDLLRNHIYKEDHILFDVVDKCLTKEQDQEVVAEFGKFAPCPDLCRRLHALEWQYLRKTA